MTKKDKYEWQELIVYIGELLNYNHDIGVPRLLCQRLKGMACNMYLPKSNGKMIYSYNTILLSCKLNEYSIKKALNSVQFDTEQHKINYVMTIIEGSLNDIVKAIKAKKQSKKIEDITYIHLNELATAPKAEYIKKSKGSKIVIDDIW